MSLYFLLKKLYLILRKNSQSWLAFFQFICSKPSLINVPTPCRSEEKMGEACVTYGGQNYVHTFVRPVHTGKENLNQLFKEQDGNGDWIYLAQDRNQ